MLLWLYDVRHGVSSNSLWYVWNHHSYGELYSMRWGGNSIPHNIKVSQPPRGIVPNGIVSLAHIIIASNRMHAHKRRTSFRRNPDREPYSVCGRSYKYIWYYTERYGPIHWVYYLISPSHHGWLTPEWN